jgi:Zn-dependent M28 family amino/carboxypeptidase
MKKYALLAVMMILLTLILNGSDLSDRAAGLTKEQMQSVIEFLSNDALEGRAPGTRGGELAEIYMHSLFKLFGLSSHFQPFVLKGYQIKDMLLEAAGQRLHYLEDVVGSYTRDEKEFNLEGEAVFAGFGIRTAIWKWDDYKKYDCRDKILIVRVNDPGLFNPGIFEGSALTYFGRWIYKIEEAAKTGAKAILLIHTTPTAGYDWNVVKNSWGGESLYLPSTLENNLAFKGWIKEDRLKSILKGKNIDLNRLYQQSLKRKFKPVALGFKIKISGQNDFRRTEARNVIGEMAGQTGQNIVISAHIDHLGRNERLSGDQIFNGAIDNGAAVAAMALVAKIYTEAGITPYYGLTFLACQAEEEGLLGSKYFVANAERENIVANINFESTPVWEKSLDAFALGARYSTLEEIIKKITAEIGLEYSEFSLTDQGFYFRADQFSFARHSIPAVWLSAGEKFASGRNKIGEFFKGGAYHTVKDEYNSQWELESLKQTVTLAVMLIERLNQNQEIPRLKTRLTFPLETSADKTSRQRRQKY